MPSPVLTTMLVVANITGVGMIVPQVLRLHRTRSVAGLSGGWLGVGIVLNGWWTAYAIARSVWPILPVSVGALVLYLVLTLQWRHVVGAGALRPVARGAAALGTAPLVALTVGDWSTAGLAIGMSYAVQFAPAAVSAVRSDRVDGISPVTWTMAWVEAAVWMVYGSTITDPALLVGGTGGLAMATVILVRISSGRTRGSRDRAARPSALRPRPRPAR